MPKGKSSPRYQRSKKSPRCPKRKAVHRASKRRPAPSVITAAIHAVPAPPAASIEKPQWRAHSRQLFFGGVLVKRLTQPAKNLDVVLATFELKDWCEHIDDPLPFDPDVDPHDRLHNTVRRLNQQRNALIKFHLDGLGKGIYWERRQQTG